jgi:hypothetical protein
MSVSEEGSLACVVRRGADAEGIVMVRTKPRMADVRIRDLSRALLSCATSRDRNRTNGLIMYEFHKKASSRFPISNEVASVYLQALRLVSDR